MKNNVFKKFTHWLNMSDDEIAKQKELKQAKKHQKQEITQEKTLKDGFNNFEDSNDSYYVGGVGFEQEIKPKKKKKKTEDEIKEEPKEEIKKNIKENEEFNESNEEFNEPIQTKTYDETFQEEPVFQKDETPLENEEIVPTTSHKRPFYSNQFPTFPLSFYLDVYNDSLKANLPTSYSVFSLLKNDLKKLHQCLIDEFLTYETFHKDAIYKEILKLYPLSAISDFSALSFFNLNHLYANYNWNYLKNNLLDNLSFIEKEENNTKKIKDKSDWNIDKTNSLFQTQSFANYISNKNNYHKQNDNLNFFNEEKITNSELLNQITDILKQKPQTTSSDVLNDDHNDSNDFYVNNYATWHQRYGKKEIDLTKETNPIKENSSENPSFIAIHRKNPLIFLYDDTTKNILWVLNFIINKIVVLNYVNDLLKDNATNYNIISLDIYKQNLIKQILLNPYAFEWKIFNLFHSIYPLKAKQLTFNFIDFENALNYYDLGFDDLILYCNLYFANTIPASLFIDVHEDNINNEWIKNLPQHLKTKSILQFQPPILKQNIYLKNKDTNLRQLIIPQGSILPVTINLKLDPIDSSGKFAFSILLNNNLVFDFDVNLNDLDFVRNKQINADLVINEHNAVLKIKYAFSEKLINRSIIENSNGVWVLNNKENKEVRFNLDDKQNLISNSAFATITLINNYDFFANYDDRTHFNYLNLLSNLKDYEIKNMDLFSKEVLNKPLVFNDLLQASITSGDKLFQQDLISSFAYLMGYNHLHKEDKIDLQRLIFYNENPNNNNLNFYKQARSFQNSYFKDDFDMMYLTQGLNFYDAKKIIKKHRFSIWKWRLKMKR